MNNTINYLKEKWFIIAGPCAVESEGQIIKCAAELKKHHIGILRAGIWKPRTNPDSWQGEGDKAIEWMCKAREKYGIAIATEVKDLITLKKVLEARFDLLWIGSRNGMNYSLLEEAGKATKGSKTPVIVKRAMVSSLEEWLGAAKYVQKHNPKVILCERGIRGFSPDTRNILDLQTAYLAKVKSGLPVIVDVCHAAGRTDLITPMSKAVKVVGFNGLMVEMHPNPKEAKSDQLQQLSFSQFDKLMTNI